MNSESQSKPLNSREEQLLSVRQQIQQRFMDSKIKLTQDQETAYKNLLLEQAILEHNLICNDNKGVFSQSNLYTTLSVFRIIALVVPDQFDEATRNLMQNQNGTLPHP